jgi:hypothetical protein
VFKERGALGHAGMVLGYQACMQALDGWRVVVLSNANRPHADVAERRPGHGLRRHGPDSRLPGGLAAGPAR